MLQGVRAGDTLSDGRGVGLCLWAAALSLPHPASGQPLQLDISARVEAAYAHILRAEAQAEQAASSAATAPPTPRSGPLAQQRRHRSGG